MSLVRKHLVVAGLVVAVSALSSVALAQGGRGGPGGFGGPGGGGPGGPGGFGGFGGRGMGGGGDLFLLQNDDVRQELGLVDDQVEKLTQIGEKAREEMRSMFQGFGRGGNNNNQNQTDEERQARFEEIRKKMQEQTDAMQKEIDGVLLPHQSKRLKQISRQQRLRQFGGQGLNPEALADELKLTEEQKEKLRERAQEVAKKLTEKLAKLRKEAEDDLLSVLSPDQRAEYKDLVGEPFEMQRRGFGGPGGGGPGGGGPVGGAPGGQNGRGGRPQGGN